MATTTISSGVTSSGLTISGASTLVVLSGGIVSASKVVSGGTETISSGGKSYNDVISGLFGTKSATQNVYGIASGAILSSGAVQNVLAGGTVYGADLLAGSTQTVSSGGTAYNDIVAGGRENVSSGGADVSATVQSGNIMWIYADATGSGEIVSGGANSTAEISNQGTTTNVSVYVSGSEVVSSGGVANTTHVFNGGALIVSGGGSAAGTVISSGGTETVSSGGIETGSIVSSGGDEVIATGGKVSGATIDGGTLELQSGAIVSGAITFGTVVGTLQVDGTTMPTNVISGFSVVGDAVVLDGVSYNTSETLAVSGNTVTVTNGHTAYALDIAGATTTHLQLVNDGGLLEVEYVACFLRGTHIATPAGERRIEDLAAGDAVTVLEDGATRQHPIRWIGQRAVRSVDFAEPDEAYPVRIRRHAFGENVPHRDLLVTPEHCVLVEGRLIPARMLVNGRSIVLDRGIPEYEFFHIELDRHGILLSEGLATESYLDGGNRHVFASADMASAPLPPSPAPVMAAPLATDRDTVEPVWRRLDERAVQLGLDEQAPACAGRTQEPDLRLLLDNGEQLRPDWFTEARLRFWIPRDRQPVQLLSRAAAPAGMIGPFVDDRRRLGVLVEQLVLWHGLAETVHEAEALGGTGWHDLENGARWTNGAAELSLPCAANGETFLDVRLRSTAVYPLAIVA